MLVAEIFGEARHHARWRPLTEAEETAAVAGLRALAGGRGDLLAEVAGSSRGLPRANSTSRWPGAPRGYAAWQEPTSR
jgi:hypothetical protein